MGGDIGASGVGIPGTFANIINSFFGSGVLGLPYAFKMSGWLAGTVTLVTIAFISRFCMELLLICRAHVLDKDIKEEEQDHKSQGSYGDIGREAFGEAGAKIVDYALCFTQTGFCCVYMIFLGNNLHSVFPHVSVNSFITYCMIALVCVSWLRSLKWLSPFSLFAEICTIMGLCIVNVYAVVFYEPPEPVETSIIIPSTFPMFFGIAAAAYEGIGLVIPIQQSMAEPEKYSRLLNISMACVTIFFIVTGLTSYFCFGEETQSIISLNLPSNELSSIVKLTLCGAIFFTYPIQLFPVIQILEGAIFDKNMDTIEQETTLSSLLIKRNVLRSCLVMFTALAAVLIPHFGEVIGLIGSIGASMLAFTLPATFYLKIFGSTMEQRQKIGYYGIICFGILGGIAASAVVVAFGED